jgi:GntR family transcriptional regulator, arabinose operon transcriptional repressor
MLRQIDTAVPLPKYYQIGESIKEKIFSGAYSEGEKLPTVRKLAEYFDTTLVTVSNAMRLLNDGGYIDKIHGKGMFIKNPSIGAVEKIDAKFKRIGLLMPVKNDLYQNIADVLIHTLEDFDYFSVPLGTRLMNQQPTLTLDEKEVYLKKYIENGFDAMIINGERHFPYKLLHRYKDKIKQLNFITQSESALDFPQANLIAVDFEQVGYLAGKYLIEQGKTRLAMITYEQLTKAEERVFGTRHLCSDNEVITGINRALQEAGLIPEEQLTVIYNHGNKPMEDEHINSELRAFMEQGKCGIMAMGDFRALHAYETAKTMNLELGKDCSIVGLYNTHWSTILKPELTSISVNEREIGKLMAKCVIEKWQGKTVKVAPTLIVRET